MNKTVIYITNNILDEKIDKIVKKNILESIGDLPLISVSHKPIDFGKNICVGEMDSNSLSINIQMLKALEEVNTEYIAIAEHDVLYTEEYFKFTPPDRNIFYYNEHVYMLQTYSKDFPQYNGMFSFFKGRKANSQLTVATDIMVKATQDKIDMMSDPAWFKRYPSGRIGEAGAMDYNHAMRLSRGKSLEHIREKLKKYINDYHGENWICAFPNIDIRHKDNFTKNTRGTKRCYKLPYWGTMEDIWQKI